MAKQKLSSYMKSRRENIGMTQKELAKKIGVTDVTISRWESGQREPTWTYFLKLCVELGMKAEDFMEDEEPRKGE